MMLRAAFVPPDEVLDELRQLGRHVGALPGVQLAGADRLDVPVAGFGNVSSADVTRLARVLRERVGDEPAPIVRFSGVALDASGDVVVDLSGDTVQLERVARATLRVAESVNLYADRRRYRSAVVLASTGQQRPGSTVGPLLGRVAEWSGMAWEAAGISLLRTRWLGGGAVSEEIGFVELALPVELPVERPAGLPVERPAGA